MNEIIIANNFGNIIISIDNVIETIKQLCKNNYFGSALKNITINEQSDMYVINININKDSLKIKNLNDKYDILKKAIFEYLGISNFIIFINVR